MEKNNDRNGRVAGRSYAPPSLRIYGGVLELTAAGTVGLAESGTSLNNPNRDRP